MYAHVNVCMCEALYACMIVCTCVCMFTLTLPAHSATLHHTSTHCNILQPTTVVLDMARKATSCNAPKDTATRCNTLQPTTMFLRNSEKSKLLQHTATHCNTLQHTATHCNTLQHTATHCNTLQHTTKSVVASFAHARFLCSECIGLFWEDVLVSIRGFGWMHWSLLGGCIGLFWVNILDCFG